MYYKFLFYFEKKEEKSRRKGEEIFRMSTCHCSWSFLLAIRCFVFVFFGEFASYSHFVASLRER
jgi:hypothetical protein